MGGILPFGCIFIQLFFILNSIWSHQIYYMFGFLLLGAVLNFFRARIFYFSQIKKESFVKILFQTVIKSCPYSDHHLFRDHNSFVLFPFGCRGLQLVVAFIHDLWIHCYLFLYLCRSLLFLKGKIRTYHQFLRVE